MSARAGFNADMQTVKIMDMRDNPAIDFAFIVLFPILNWIRADLTGGNTKTTSDQLG